MDDGNDGPSRYERYYDRMREQIRAENTLYNQRIIWLITMQAFLFATLGLMLQAKFSDGAADEPFIFNAIMLLLAVMGVLVAIVSTRTLRQAVSVLDSLGKTWNDAAKRIPEEELPWLPHPKGRDDSAAGRFDRVLLAGHLPYVFIVAWLGFMTIHLLHLYGWTEARPAVSASAPSATLGMPVEGSRPGTARPAQPSNPGAIRPIDPAEGARPGAATTDAAPGRAPWAAPSER